MENTPFQMVPWIFGLGAVGIILFFALIVAAIALKGYALWHAARRDEVGWFVALLVVNTMGILELVYLAFVVKKWSKKGVAAPTSAPSSSSSTTTPEA